jgi:hypothetical protein
VGTASNYSTPPRANQPALGNSIDTGDTRISGMVFYMSGSLYASLNTNGGGGGSACVLYEIKPFIDTGTGGITSARINNEIFWGSGTNFLVLLYPVAGSRG